MLTLRLPKRLLDRVLAEVRVAGELGLAFLMTAGVASCGGTLNAGDGGVDGSGETDGPTADHPGIEACCFEAAGDVEAAMEAGADSPTVEAAMEAGADVPIVVEAAEAGGFDSPVIVEAAMEAGFQDHRVVPEAPSP